MLQKKLSSLNSQKFLEKKRYHAKKYPLAALPGTLLPKKTKQKLPPAKDLPHASQKQPLCSYLLFSPGFAPPTISAETATKTTTILQPPLFLSHPRPLMACSNLLECSSTCQSPTTTSKSKVDSLAT